MNTYYFKSLLYGGIFLILTAFVDNPFYSCATGDCNAGKGFPIPFRFEKFCAPGNANCLDAYFSGATFLLDLVFVLVAFFVGAYLYRLFFGGANDSGEPMYKIRN